MKERWQGQGVASALLGQLPCFVRVCVCAFVFVLVFVFVLALFLVFQRGVLQEFCIWIPLSICGGCFSLLDPTRACGGCFCLFGFGSHSHLRWLLSRVSFVDSCCAAPAAALLRGWFPRALALAVPRAPSLTGFGVCPRGPRWTGQCQWLKVS